MGLWCDGGDLDLGKRGGGGKGGGLRVDGRWKDVGKAGM